MKSSTNFVIGLAVGIAATVPGFFPTACSAQKRAEIAAKLRPSCEAALLASPDVQELAGQLEITPTEYVKAACAMPGIAMTLDKAAVKAP